MTSHSSSIIIIIVLAIILLPILAKIINKHLLGDTSNEDAKPYDFEKVDEGRYIEK